jgi:hypothetical protein
VAEVVCWELNGKNLIRNAWRKTGYDWFFEEGVGDVGDNGNDVIDDDNDGSDGANFDEVCDVADMLDDVLGLGSSHGTTGHKHQLNNKVRRSISAKIVLTSQLSRLYRICAGIRKYSLHFLRHVLYCSLVCAFLLNMAQVRQIQNTRIPNLHHSTNLS